MKRKLTDQRPADLAATLVISGFGVAVLYRLAAKGVEGTYMVRPGVTTTVSAPPIGQEIVLVSAYLTIAFGCFAFSWAALNYDSWNDDP